MTTYSVTFARSARKELERLQEPILFRVLDRNEALGSDPRPRGCRKLEGADELWRIRIGDYRVIYSIDDSRQAVDISAIRPRGGAYW